MRQLFENQFEKISSTDINNLQLALNKGLQDDFMYNFFGGPANGVLNTSFKMTYVGALAASLAAGVGMYYDNTQVGYSPLFRMIQSSTAISVVFGAASVADRIDVVCLAPNFVTVSNALRYVKTGGVGPITLTSVPKNLADSYTLQVVAGTPGVSPVAPAVPAGFIPIAQAYIHGGSGMASGADITDTRNILTIAVNSSGHTFAVASTLQGQLDQLDAQAVVMKDTAFQTLASIDPSGTPTKNLLAADSGKVFEVICGNGVLTINSNAAPGTNFKFTVVDKDGNMGLNPVTFVPNGAQKIMGLNSNFIMRAPWGRYTFAFNGTDYHLVAG